MQTVPPDLLEDMYVQSSLAAGHDSVRDNIERAARLGLRRIACVDQVQRNSTWVPTLVSTAQQLRQDYDLEIFVGVAARFCDEHGTLDLPDALPGIDFIVTSGDQVPIGRRCYTADELRSLLRQGQVSAERVVRAILNAAVRVMLRYPNVVLSNLFGGLSTIGFPEESVPLEWLLDLAGVAHISGSAVLLDERYRCPGLRTLQVMKRASVPLFLCSGSSERNTIGVYSHVAEMMSALRGNRRVVPAGEPILQDP